MCIFINEYFILTYFSLVVSQYLFEMMAKRYDFNLKTVKTNHGSAEFPAEWTDFKYMEMVCTNITNMMTAIIEIAFNQTCR